MQEILEKRSMTARVAWRAGYSGRTRLLRMFWGEVEGPECGGVSSLFSLRWDRVLFRLKAKIEGTGRALWVSKFGRTGKSLIPVSTV